MSRTIVIPLAVVCASLALVACAGDERLAPAGEGGGDGATVATSTSTGETPPDPDPDPPPVREVFQRNPFGNVAESGNLLWDGDFEWHSSFADQYGWIEGYSFGIRRPIVGPTCRSGLKCAQLGSMSSIVGIGVASEAADLYVSAWVKPESGSCTTTEVALFAEGLDGDAADAPIPPASDAPDAEGWCHHEGVVPQRNDKSYVLVHQTAPGQLATVDDVVVRRVTEAESQLVPRLAASVPTATLLATLEEARAALRAVRGPRDDVPDPLKRALERQSRGEGRRILRLATPPRTPGGRP